MGILILRPQRGICNLVDSMAISVRKLIEPILNSVRVVCEKLFVFQKNGNVVVPHFCLLHSGKGLQHQDSVPAAAAPVPQSGTAVGIEPPAIDGIAMERTVRGNIEVEKTSRLQYAQHLIERQPKKLRMLKARRGQTRIDRVVVKRQNVRILENNIDALGIGKIDADISIVWRCFASQRTIDILRTDFDNRQTLSTLEVSGKKFLAKVLRGIVHRFSCCRE